MTKDLYKHFIELLKSGRRLCRKVIQELKDDDLSEDDLSEILECINKLKDELIILQAALMKEFRKL
ncbi:MAG: hypothetical protein J6P61_01890 [Erysipelotrichaceae bacterium]|nr:hypothetical protein [Erysipelotrichaceae bacterium]